MFQHRTLSEEVEAVRQAHAPEALVLSADSDFETLAPAIAEQLGLVVEELSPQSYPTAWLPSDAPEALLRYASGEFTVGAPGDGGVMWTRQTTPPAVIVKPRTNESPEPFVSFLVAEALVEVGLDWGGSAAEDGSHVPEHFLGFFREQYRDLDAVVALDPTSTYQLAAALYTGWLGTQTRSVFADWEGEFPTLYDTWRDAGERLQPRLGSLTSDVASGRTSFSTAAELACAAIKHTGESADRGPVDLPSPFDALATDAYREHGAAFAVKWAEKTFSALE